MTMLRKRLGRPLPLLLAQLAGILGLVFLLLPTLVVVPISVGPDKYLHFPPRGFTLDWYRQLLGDPAWIKPALFSLKIAVIVAVLSTVLGTMAAYALTRGRLRGEQVVSLATLAPIIAPNIVIGVAMYLFFSRLGLSGSLVAFVLAHTVLATPYVIITVSASLVGTDADLDMAAMSLGATRWGAFRHVTLPLIMPGIIAGAVFAFIVSFDEPVVSFFLSSVRDKTLPRKIFEDLDFDVSPVVAAVSTLLTFSSIGFLALIGVMKRVGARRGVVSEG
ncbi:ABC transporter permease [Bosea sp. TWI1241]|jgi:mannopine transport system permease protein|uniref:ABC transporter permease n=1 Tax=Bosea sp. TWI1241 TaxID=3148904 RepID=UPI00320A6411